MYPSVTCFQTIFTTLRAWDYFPNLVKMLAFFQFILLQALWKNRLGQKAGKSQPLEPWGMRPNPDF
jgi:hypothetical protein